MTALERIKEIQALLNNNDFRSAGMGRRAFIKIEFDQLEFLLRAVKVYKEIAMEAVLGARSISQLQEAGFSGLLGIDKEFERRMEEKK